MHLGSDLPIKDTISKGLFEKLFNDGINLVTVIRNNMKNQLIPIYDRLLLRKNSVIETINDELKNITQTVNFLCSKETVCILIKRINRNLRRLRLNGF